jgi:hypothetical protein
LAARSISKEIHSLSLSHANSPHSRSALEYYYLGAAIELMDLKSEILTEHTKAKANKIVKWVGNDPKRFHELVQVFLEGPYRVTQRAGWPLSYCIENHPKLVTPHFSKLLGSVRKPGIHDSVKRNVVRLLQFVDIPHRYKGKVWEICYSFLADPKEPIAVRVFSLSVLGNLATEHSELANELKIMIEDQLPYATAAFASRAKGVLRKLKG